jgi:hypothetical protein
MKSRSVFALALAMQLGSASVWSQESKVNSNPAQARLPQSMRDVGNPSFTKIERKITKEPVYQKTPKYCLVVFGAEAKTRIWVVVDGDTLYADLNGNRDLTEKAEQFKEGKDPYGHGHSWQLGDIVDGEKKFKHTEFTIHNFNDYEFRIGVDAAYEGIPSLYGFAQLKFGSKPANAPIVHFGGPLSMGMSIATIEDRPGFICAQVGTPGLGEGSFVYYTRSVMCGIAAKLCPEIQFKYTGEQNRIVREKARFYRVPFEKVYLCTVVPGEKDDKRLVEITLSFSELRAIDVTSRTFSRPIVTLQK